MVFASLFFLFIFLPLCVFFYYSTKNPTWRNWVLIIFSLAFYGWGEPIWISLLILSSLVDWGNSIFIEKHRGTKWAKIGVTFTVVFNLALLATFKYDQFIVDQVNALLGTSFSAPGYALPLGISFYTFHTISYVVDVYRGDIKAQRNFPNFLMYVSLFSSLVAGPIIRYAHVEKEIYGRKESFTDFSLGVTRFCIGLFKKVVIANIAAELVRKYMGDHSDPLTFTELASLSSWEAWFGLLMFAIQIYFDFSGYSDMAIGLGRMFGFHFRENFNYPYISKSIGEFWRRWHISLGSIFRDYVYIPLGGNKKRVYLNLFVVWFLTGMWHGPSWNFIFWGLYFFIFIALERAFLLKLLEKAPAFISHIYALVIIIPGWVIFYFTDTQMLFAYVQKLFSFSPGPNGNADLTNTVTAHLFWLLLALILCMPVYHVVKKWIDKKANRVTTYDVLSIGFNVVLLFLCVAQLVGKSYNPFIYFRF
ncbi:MAG: MBOAT family protein [Chitinophagaceae bacterium]|nr:MBOAT family protein [Chitinophagaceae bacterium]MBP9103770.1 MBOAT family protein [Chitinophagaceae bacterium]